MKRRDSKTVKWWDLSQSQAGGGVPSVLNWAGEAGVSDEVLAVVEKQLKRRRRRRVVAACAAGTLAALVFAFGWELPRPAQAPAANLAMLSAPARRVLSDGSVIELKDGADVDVQFGPQDPVRRVSLKRGEAHFQVAKNHLRPFVVEANGVEVRAVGTGFSVELGQGQVEVLVTEGRVSVEKPAAGASPAEQAAALTYVDAGRRVVVDLSPRRPSAEVSPVTAVSAVEFQDRMGWRVPRLDLSGTPLSEVVPIFKKNSGMAIVLGDPSIGEIKLSGVLRADNIDALLQLLASNYGITAERRGPSEIVLRRAE